MSYLSIGSGDVKFLLSGLQTKGYESLWRKFHDENPPYYNAYASPIDALRTGAILEDRYGETMPDDVFLQRKETCKGMDVFTSSIDFAKINDGKIVDFEELKTIWFTDYVEKILGIKSLGESDQIKKIKKLFKSNYEQVQFQLLCSGLDSAYLSFLSVTSYNDDENYSRVIEDKDVTKFRIYRDEEVISKCCSRGAVFQIVKDHFN